ncbi:hypothetical protein MML48_4g00009500 [Holotrichia oblita]|uniref:Uncharacterized protein n=1 Tax=Holotrichia oblita TaxID=644536 RepID=A0ACB9T7C0_HOLOL|nr:hypothetical protein MML48_4g00009500 [Holotrichia oblita]
MLCHRLETCVLGCYEIYLKAPIPASNWEGVREVNNVVLTCVQCGFGGCPGTEDCLYLNVYTSQVRVSSVLFYSVSNPPNEPAFLSDKIITLIQTGNYNHVPFVIGHNNAEGLFIHIPVKLMTGQNITTTDFTGYIPSDLKLQPGSEEEAIIAARIREFCLLWRY